MFFFFFFFFFRVCLLFVYQTPCIIPDNPHDVSLCRWFIHTQKTAFVMTFDRNFIPSHFPGLYFELLILGISSATTERDIFRAISTNAKDDEEVKLKQILTNKTISLAIKFIFFFCAGNLYSDDICAFFVFSACTTFKCLLLCCLPRQALPRNSSRWAWKNAWAKLFQGPISLWNRIRLEKGSAKTMASSAAPA